MRFLFKLVCVVLRAQIKENRMKRIKPLPVSAMKRDIDRVLVHLFHSHEEILTSLTAIYLKLSYETKTMGRAPGNPVYIRENFKPDLANCSRFLICLFKRCTRSKLLR